MRLSVKQCPGRSFFDEHPGYEASVKQCPRRSFFDEHPGYEASVKQCFMHGTL